MREGVRWVSKGSLSVRENVSVTNFYPNVSLFFADVCRFTDMSARTTPEGIVTLLNHMFEIFDQQAEQHGVEKIKTLGRIGWGGVDSVFEAICQSTSLPMSRLSSSCLRVVRSIDVFLPR